MLTPQSQVSPVPQALARATHPERGGARPGVAKVGVLGEARQAHGSVRSTPCAPVEGLAAQQAWMLQQAQDLGYASLDELVRRDSAALARLAVQWRVNHRPAPPRVKSSSPGALATLALVAQTMNLSVQDCLRANRPADALRVLRDQQPDRLMRAILQRLGLLMRECEQQGGVRVQLQVACATDAGTADAPEELEAGTLAHALVSECLQLVLGRMLRAPATQVCREHRLAVDRLREIWAQTRRFEVTSARLGEDAKLNLADFVDQVLQDGSLRASMRAQPWRMGTLWHAFKQGVLAALGLREGEMLLGTMADSVDEILRRGTGAGVRLSVTLGASQASPS